MDIMVIGDRCRSDGKEIKNTNKKHAKKIYSSRNIFSLLLAIYFVFNVVITMSLFLPLEAFAGGSSYMPSDVKGISDANATNTLNASDDTRTGTVSQKQSSISTVASENVSITFKDADLRDILSALALAMNVNIILAEEPVTTSFSINNVSPRTALIYLLKTLGMEYVEKGNLIVVGNRETLENDFMNQMSLTRFNLKYITSDVLNSQIDVLGIPVKKIILEKNNKAIWVQGTPQSISKVKELISMLDVEENSAVEEEKVEVVESFSITPFKLEYISAETLERLIREMDINTKTLTLDENPNTIWVDAKGQALENIKELVAKIDIVDNYAEEFENEQPLILIPYTLNFVTPEIVNDLIAEMQLDVKTIYFKSNPNKIWIDARSNDIEDFEELITKVDLFENANWPINIETLKLKNITASKLKAMAEELGLTAHFLTLESRAYTAWLVGDSSTIHDVKFLVNEIERNNINKVPSFFIYDLLNITADEAVKRFELLNIEDAKVIALNYPLFAKEVLVIAPSDMENDIRQILADFDKTGRKIRVPIDYSNHVSGQSKLTARRELLVSLTGIPASSFHISGNVSKTDTPHYVMWIEETPENIAKVKDMIDFIDNP